jgi:hypothetical protein
MLREIRGDNMKLQAMSAEARLVDDPLQNACCWRTLETIGKTGFVTLRLRQAAMREA